VNGFKEKKKMTKGPKSSRLSAVEKAKKRAKLVGK
jgi:hypothetical protein